MKGKVYRGGTFNADGEFKFYTFDKITSTDAIIMIQAFVKVS
ncbi:immunoglobulin-like domain-containing protein [Listeria sp. SHR_NRA_18]